MIYCLMQFETHFFHRLVRFKNTWLLEPDLNDVVRTIWDKALLGDCLSKINCTAEMNAWGRRNFTDQIEACRRDLDQIHQGHIVDDTNQYQEL